MVKAKRDNDSVKDDNDLTPNDDANSNVAADGADTEDSELSEEEDLGSWELESDLEE